MLLLFSCYLTERCSAQTVRHLLPCNCVSSYDGVNKKHKWIPNVTLPCVCQQGALNFDYKSGIFNGNLSSLSFFLQANAGIVNLTLNKARTASFHILSKYSVQHITMRCYVRWSCDVCEMVMIYHNKYIIENQGILMIQGVYFCNCQYNNSAYSDYQNLEMCVI